MTSRTVMAAWLRPASLRRGPRSVYICVPEGTSHKHQEQLETVLKEILRANDRLLYSSADADSVDPIVAFAERHGLFADPIVGEGSAPDLIVIIVDPLRDNTAALQARTLATHGDSDLLIAELPDLPS